ncbi:hypothetical protein FFF34_005070 [Inquilinus sp. KBS0705]|nr:hypothetical protein FFF34_005070 [Inquilinus sp. KBS0705]
MALQNDDDCFEELSESEYEIADGQPDIIGWDIKDSHHNKLGEVDELLFSVTLRKVCYIVMHMENNDIGLEDGRVLIPIGVAELDENEDTVLISNVTKAQLLALPIYQPGRNVDKETEQEIRNIFTDPNVGVTAGKDFHDHEHFSETKFYGKRWTKPFSNYNEDEPDIIP